MGFDNQLGAVERTLLAKTKDYEELLLLSGDANHAREVKGEPLCYSIFKGASLFVRARAAVVYFIRISRRRVF